MLLYVGVDMSVNLPASAKLKAAPDALPRKSPPVVREAPWGLTGDTADLCHPGEGERRRAG